MSNSKVSSYFDNPFSVTPHRYFLASELNQRLNLIRHLVQNSEQLLLVLAETGCGKSSLLKQLQKTDIRLIEEGKRYEDREVTLRRFNELLCN